MDDLKYRFEKACKKFQSNEQYLIQNNLGERVLSHKLAEHLQKEFGEYNVDCEYNKNITETKRLREIKEFVRQTRNNGLSNFEEEHGINVSPDIIIHIRGSNTHNKIVVEIKKANSPIKDEEFDKLKIEFYMKELNYSLGIFVKIGIDKFDVEFF